MEQKSERRRERRLRYYWPVWFAEDFNQILCQGQMIDVSSTAAAFTYYPDQDCPYPGQPITARFSVPCFSSDSSFNLANFTRSGSVRRVEKVNNFLSQIAVQFAEPLPFKPGEQGSSELDTVQRLKAVTI